MMLSLEDEDEIKFFKINPLVRPKTKQGIGVLKELSIKGIFRNYARNFHRLNDVLRYSTKNTN